MELDKPFTVITSGVDGDVLRVLASSREQLSVPRLHAMVAEHSVAGIRNSVRRLVTQGVVLTYGIGRDRLYALNDEHLAAGALREIAGLKAAFFTRLKARISSWATPPAFGAVFGSAARDDMTAGSDIDIALVRTPDADDDEWLTQIANLTRDVTAWTGNDTRILDLTREDLDDESLRPLLDAIVADGIVVTDDTQWLRGALRRKAVG